jgi:hypothetical protein
MVLRRMGVDHHFHRDCGPEIARGRKAEQLRKTAAGGDWLMVKALLDDDADIDLPDPFDRKERNALMAAAERGHVDVVKALVEAGAKVSVFDVGGNTVFDYARKRIPEAVPLLALPLPAPSSPELPVLRKLPANTKCPAQYVGMIAMCLHASALARPELEAEIAAFVQRDERPTVASNPELHALEGQVAVVGERDAKPDYRADPSRLDPGALSNPDAEREHRPSSSGTSTGARACTSPSTRAAASARANDSWDTSNSPSHEEIERRWAEIEAEEEKPAEIDTERKRQWCADTRKTLDAMRAGQPKGYAEAWGVSDSELIAAGAANYARACP